MNSGGVETIQTKRCRNLPRFVLFGGAQECLLKQGLSVAIASAQVDGPSPVPALQQVTRYGQGNGFGASALTEAHGEQPLALRIESALSLFGYGRCQRQVGDGTGAGGVIQSVANLLGTPLGKVCRSAEDCLPPLPPQTSPYAPTKDSEALPPSARLQEFDEFGALLPPWKCLAYGTLVRDHDPPAVSAGLEVAVGMAYLGDYGVLGDRVLVDPWSVATASASEHVLSRPPGINIGPSDAELDQVFHTHNAMLTSGDE